MNRNRSSEDIRIIVLKSSCHPHENLRPLLSLLLGMFLIVWLCGGTIGPRPCLQGRKMQCQPIAGPLHKGTPCDAFTRVSQFFSLHDGLSQLPSPHTVRLHICITYFLFSCDVGITSISKLVLYDGVLETKKFAANLLVFSFYDNAPRLRVRLRQNR